MSEFIGKLQQTAKALIAEQKSPVMRLLKTAAVRTDIIDDRPSTATYMREYGERSAWLNMLADRRDRLAVSLPPHHVDYIQAHQAWKDEKESFIQWVTTR